MNVRYSTREDLIAWFGNVPATMRAIVVEHDGRLVGIAGLMRGADHLQAFSAMKDELRPHKRILVKVARMLQQMIAEAQAPVLAVCSEKEPTAPGLLASLGFRHWLDGVWRHG